MQKELIPFFELFSILILLHSISKQVRNFRKQMMMAIT